MSVWRVCDEWGGGRILRMHENHGGVKASIQAFQKLELKLFKSLNSNFYATVVFVHSQYTPPAPLATHSPHTPAHSAHTTPRPSPSPPHLTRHTPHPVITTTTRTPSPSLIPLYRPPLLNRPRPHAPSLSTLITTTEMLIMRIFFVFTFLQLSMNFASHCILALAATLIQLGTRETKPPRLCDCHI